MERIKTNDRYLFLTQLFADTFLVEVVNQKMNELAKGTRNVYRKKNIEKKKR